MNKKYNKIGLAWGIPGILLQLGGQVYVSIALTLIGSVLLMAGLAYYAKPSGAGWDCCR